MTGKEYTRSKPLTAIILAAMLQIACAATAPAQEQDSTKTLFGAGTNLGFVWGPQLKWNSIQNDIGSLISFYGGALVDHRMLFALEIGANVSHPTVNYGYIGILGQYTHAPKELWHWSAQLLVASASEKDYEQAKSSLLDNFGNTTGVSFYFLEPGANIELNLGTSTRLLAGLSYRFAFGLDKITQYNEKTQVKSKDMSGVNVNIGVKIGAY